MRKLDVIARQSAHPTGWLGQLVARIMAVDTGPANGRVLARLGVQPGDRVLEVGCGHGRTLGRLLASSAPALAVGVDPSRVMRRVAARGLRREIARGRARILPGEAARIPVASASFDRAFGVHTLYFWPDLPAAIAELHRVLGPGGRLLLAYHDTHNPRKVAELPASVYRLRPAEDVAEALREGGFRDVLHERIHTTRLVVTRAIRPEIP